MAKSRKSHAPEFKARLVVEALKEQRAVQQIASDNGINPNLLFKWRKEFLAHPERVFDEGRRERGSRRKEAEVEAERDEMLKKIGRLAIEHDYLRRSCERLGVDPGPRLPRR